MTDSIFILQTAIETGQVRFSFMHSGGIARGASIHVGRLVDGQARSGDGWDAGDIERDLLAVVFDAEEVDSTSVTADYALGVSTASRFGIFVLWSSGDGSYREALGIEMDFSAERGFTEVQRLEGESARRFLLETEMVSPATLRANAREPELGERFFDLLSVEGYRGFSSAESLRFAQPTGSQGSGLTIIVGANNSGKSTFIEAIQLVAAARQRSDLTVSQPRRHRDTDAVSIALSRLDGRKLSIRSRRPGGSATEVSWVPDAAPGKFDIHVTPSRRSFAPYFGNTGVRDRDWGLMDQEMSRNQSRDNFIGRLRKVDDDDEARAKFDPLLEEIIGAPLAWRFDEIATAQQFLKLTDQSGASHSSEGLGDGLVSLLFIVDALYDSQPGSLIAIDEPELSLHPQLVKRLRRVLSRYAADRQIVIATHSPLLIDWNDIANGASIARVFKSDGGSKIAQASGASLSAAALLAEDRNLHNPHIVGVVAREAFFLDDGIVLTEGQDDVVYLPRVLADLAIEDVENVYGWGAGGATNLPTVAALFTELGFTRVAVILDDDGSSETQRAEDRLNDLAPTVLVRRIPAHDIRHKKEVKSKPEVPGLLAEDGIHVRAELRDAAFEALRAIVDHVSVTKQTTDAETS